MSNDLKVVRKFTDFMNAGFCGKWLPDFPEHSTQHTKALLLADGTDLSIQASWGHYCEPRKNVESGDYDSYTSFEIGFPSNKIDEIMEYAEDYDNPTDTVYGYVPKQVIQDFIDKRGGVVGWKVNGEDDLFITDDSPIRIPS